MAENDGFPLPGKATATIKLKNDLMEIIHAKAALENRNFTNMVETMLMKQTGMMKQNAFIIGINTGKAVESVVVAAENVSDAMDKIKLSYGDTADYAFESGEPRKLII